MFSQIKGASYSLRSVVAQEPSLWMLYHPYTLWGRLKRLASGYKMTEGFLMPDTELVIDGFQGSANSFAERAFRLSQTQPVKIAHHSHAPVEIIRAINMGKPVILTIREPLGTILSLTSRWSYISITQGLKSYVRFYTKLKPYASHCVISTFQLTTNHLDYIVNAVNIKYNTNFDLVDVTTANLRRKYQVNQSREAFKQRRICELESQKNAELLLQAKKIYEEFEDLAPQVTGISV